MQDSKNELGWQSGVSDILSLLDFLVGMIEMIRAVHCCTVYNLKGGEGEGINELNYASDMQTGL